MMIFLERGGVSGDDGGSAVEEAAKNLAVMLGIEVKVGLDDGEWGVWGSLLALEVTRY